MRFLCIALLCTIGVGSLGCGCSREPQAVSDPAATAPVATPVAEPTEEQSKAAETLRAAGVELAENTAGQITEANLGDTEATDALATQIALLDQLQKLTIRESTMTGDGWQALGTLHALQQLDLRDCPLDNAQLTAVVSDLSQLRALRLNGTSGRTTVDDDGLSALANCPELKVLAVDGLWVSGQGLEHLKKNLKLSELYAAGTTLDDDAVAVLAGLPALRKLRLSQTTVGTAGLAALDKLPLEDLDVSEASSINDETLAVIGKMKTLKRLNLWRDTVTDAGAEHLAGLTQLEWLNVDNTHLTDAGLPYLKDMTSLKFLHLGSTGVTDEGMPALVSLKSLKDLKVTRTAVTEKGAEVVRQAIPSINIQLKYIEGE